MARWSVFDLVEAFQLAQAVAALQDLDLLKAMQRPFTAKELAARHGVDPNLLRGTLEYVAARTDLLRKTGEKFIATRNYAENSRFLIDLYVGAFGRNAAQLSKLLRNPHLAPAAVDRARHGRAFAAVEGPPLGLLPSLIAQLGFNQLLDLGCGNGGLLLEVAENNSQFLGWGLEQNPAMCKLAGARIRAAGVADRIKVLQGDCLEMDSALPAKIIAQVRAVSACNVANEMFAAGHARTISWLGALRKLFAGCPLILVDYYGRLGQKQFSKRDASLRATLLHDYAQVISGQGVPPVDLKEWRSIYRKAGCRLVHVIEDKSTTRFIHLLSL